MLVPDLIAHEAAPAPAPPGVARPWWEGRPFVVAMILLAVVPLLYPPFPPLVDLPGHMGRTLYVARHLASSPWLWQWYDFHWHPIGNLGVDLLVWPLIPALGVEGATKLVVMTIPPLAVAGMLWVAREVHNRLPPTAAFALPLAYGHPFLYGFVNFSLSMAMALLALGLWMRLGRLGRTRLRTLLFIPISFVVFFTHTVGWGTMGLLCFSAEAVRQHDRTPGAGWRNWWRAALRAAMYAAGMALPILAMLWWRTEAQGGLTSGWFVWHRKLDYLMRVLRDRWLVWDQLCAAIVFAVPLLAIAHPRLTLSRNLFFSALVMALCFVLLPYSVFGSAYADMRMVPYVVAIWILAIRFRGDTSPRLARVLAVLAVGFMVVRTATMTASLAMAADHQERQLLALDHVPRGARMVSFVWAPCQSWALDRNAHIPALAIVRREAFSNDQWRLTGASLLTTHRPRVGYYAADPSEIVRSPTCRHDGLPMDFVLAHVPRRGFDYMWLLDMPPLSPSLLTGWRLLWAGDGSALYGIEITPPRGAKRRRGKHRPETALGRSGDAPPRTAVAIAG